MRGQSSTTRVDGVREPDINKLEEARRSGTSSAGIFDYVLSSVGIVGGVIWMVLSASATGPVGLTVGLGLGAAGLFGGCLALTSKISRVDKTQKRGR